MKHATFTPTEYTTYRGNLYHVREAGGKLLVMDADTRPLGVAESMDQAREIASSALDHGRTAQEWAEHYARSNGND